MSRRIASTIEPVLLLASIVSLVGGPVPAAAYAQSFGSLCQRVASTNPPEPEGAPTSACTDASEPQEQTRKKAKQPKDRTTAYLVAPKAAKSSDNPGPQLALGIGRFPARQPDLRNLPLGPVWQAERPKADAHRSTYYALAPPDCAHRTA